MQETVITNVCPPREVLATYAQGRLAEREATLLADHLAGCPRCQQQVDELTPAEDSLVAALREASSIHEASDPQLARLMEAAAQLDTLLPLGEGTAVSDSADWPSLAVLIERLRQSRVMAASQIEGLLDELASTSAEELADALVARHKLTPYQVAALRRGEFDHLVFGNYVVLGELGEGGMGCVYKARHQRMGRIVCLKVLHPAARRSPALVERFRREAKTVAALSHPSIVAAHDAAEEEGVPFLVMEYIEGKDLAQLVREQGPLPIVTAMEIVLQTARALEYAHARGVVHRDIKPANLLLAQRGSGLEAGGSGKSLPSPQPPTPSPQVKLLDLGLARFDAFLAEELQDSASNTMTAMGTVMGTVDYMSPEQALNSRMADARSDIYSLGCTLYFLLTGRAMFGGETAMERIVAHREHAPPMLIQMRHDVPFELHAIFLSMVAKRPNDRYQSMAEVARDLELVLAGESPYAVARSQPLLDPEPLISRRDTVADKLKWFVVIVLLTGLAALGAWLVQTTDWATMLRPR